jgi:hypothetical protein
VKLSAGRTVKVVDFNKQLDSPVKAEEAPIVIPGIEAIERPVPIIKSISGIL